MTAVVDILIPARRRVGIHADEEPYLAHESEADLAAFQDMVEMWKFDGLIAGHSAFELTTEFSIVLADSEVYSSEVDEAIIANLAIRLAREYQTTLDDKTVRDAEMGERSIRRKQNQALLTDSTFDPSIACMPSQRRYGSGSTILNQASATASGSQFFYNLSTNPPIPPTFSPVLGDRWLAEDTNNYSVYNGDVWIDVN